MNVKEAYKVLGLEETASKDDAKKAFRKLAAKYHPDVNKDTSAENEFKKINEAHQVVESGQPSTREEQQANGVGWQPTNWASGVEDFFNHFGSQRSTQRRIFAQDITLQQTLSFKESVIGCIKDITYKHNIKCNTCNGSGEKIVDNGCEICHGAGRVETQRGNTIITSMCAKCRGKASHEACNVCQSNGFVNTETTVSVNIPPGATEKSILNLGPRGNYAGTVFGADQYSKLSLTIHVKPQAGLSIINNDVICEVKVSLLEAFKGCLKSVSTIDGKKEINIPKLVKNKEEVILPNLGIARKGNQRVIVYVNYPNNIEPLIEILDKE